MKIYVVGGDTYYTVFIKDAEVVNNIEDAEIVLFTGGEDVDPSIYGKEKHYATYSNLKRDKEEKAEFEKVKENQLCVGVCRGSQFLCTMNGGILVQDCDNHGLWGTHGIYNVENDTTYQITSTHHQMQYPYVLPDKDYTIICKTYGNMCSYYEGDGVNPDMLYRHGEPEVVLYHVEGKPKCLAIQGHPEMMPDSPVAEMLNNLIKDIINERRN